MAFSSFPDPLQLCRNTLDKLENGINVFAARHMDSEEFSQALGCYTRLSVGMRCAVEHSLDRLRRQLGLPGRQEVEGLAQALRRLEDQLQQMAPESATPPPARPPRTRRPQPAASRQRASKPRPAREE
ncbi:hypothetical protein [Pseudomonas nitroreducens]|uniref:hypothetical protein n=1 Tax=Pseudomonas nitroreducens TaxID=46680 RepID=UPI003CC82E88